MPEIKTLTEYRNRLLAAEVEAVRIQEREGEDDPFSEASARATALLERTGRAFDIVSAYESACETAEALSSALRYRLRMADESRVERDLLRQAMRRARLLAEDVRFLAIQYDAELGLNVRTETEELDYHWYAGDPEDV